MEDREQTQILRELASKAKDVERELFEARAALEAEKAKHSKWIERGEVKFFGNVKTSPKIPIWFAAIVIGGVLLVLLYAAYSYT